MVAEGEGEVAVVASSLLIPHVHSTLITTAGITIIIMISIHGCAVLCCAVLVLGP